MADSEELPDSDAELSNSDSESEFASEMEITVQSDAVHNYVLLAYSDNIVEDVLVKILGSERAGRAPEPRLFFNGLELEKQKTLAEYGIEPDSVLQLKCTPRVLVQADHDHATELAKIDCAEPSSSMKPNGDDEMKIFVRSKYFGNYALDVDSSNTIRDVLVTVLPIWAVSMTPEPKLYFNGNPLEKAKSLAYYSIQDGSILHLKCSYWMSISANDPAGIAKIDSAESSSSMRPPNDDDQMKIHVQSINYGNYTLDVESSNTIQDVLVTVLPIWGVPTKLKPKLYFNGHLLETAKSLANYSIQDGSILRLECTALMFLTENDLASPTTVRPSGDGELKIFVRLPDDQNYALEVDSSNTIQDVLFAISPIWWELSTVGYFMRHPLERTKSLADYGIEDGSILHLKLAYFGFSYSSSVEPFSYERERPKRIPARDRIMMTDQPLAIWEKEHHKVFLSLLVEQISIRGMNIILNPGMDSWRNIVAKFNELTGMEYEYKHLYNRFEFYESEYRIVNRIRRHPKFSWDHQRQVVIATDAEWNEYIKQNQNARPYRRRAIPYIDLLEIAFADKEEPEIMISNE